MKHAKRIRSIAIWSGGVLGLLVILGGLIVVAETAYARLYDGQMFPGIRIFNVPVGRLTKAEARQAVQTAIDQALDSGLHFQFHGKQVNLDVTTVATDPDASRDVILYDLEPTLDQAYAIGRDHGWFRNVTAQIRARVYLQHVKGQVNLDEKRITEALHQEFHEQLRDAQDARFQISLASGTTPIVTIQKEQQGIVFRTAEAFTQLRKQAESLAFTTIPLTEEYLKPQWCDYHLRPLIPEVETLLARPPLTFVYEEKKYPIAKETLAEWLTIRTDNGVSRLDIDSERFLVSIRKVAPDIEREAKNGNLVIKDGKISAFTAGTEGVTLDADKTLKTILQDWSATTSTFPLVTLVTFGSLQGEDPERLGIKEIIGVGRSNFSGSPTNRRKNIRLGAQKVHGTIIAPGAEFSLLKTLGSIDGANGWLPELVIKGDKTTPEFGGGLCQIGTTTFRGALNSGLKILERRNHSYRVRYYEPAGTDATIYEPSPDFRFLNDTAHSMLINAYLQGDNVIFEFWGTKDGRRVDPIKSRVYNIVSPPPTKLIETLDLPPGKKTCTESAHAGADAEFMYSVTYADGSNVSELFTSHYRPWQAVCLIGVEQLTASSTATSL